MKKLNGVFWAAVCGLVAAVAGCGDVTPKEWHPRMENPPVRDVRMGDEKSIPDMEPDDVVVAVNGVTLTKAEVDIRLKRYKKMLSNMRGMQPKERDSKYRIYGKTLVSSFVNEQLFAWEGRKLGVLSEQMLRDIVSSNLLVNAKTFRCKVDDLDKVIPGGLVPLCNGIEDIAWVKAYIAKEVKIEKIVDDGIVSNVLAQIAVENRQIEASNRVIRVQLEGIRSQIESGAISFGDAAEKYSAEYIEDDSEKGHWGQFRRVDVQDEALRDAIFALGENEVSGVLEDDEGYMLVKAVQVTPESTSFARILILKEQPVVLQDVRRLKSDIQNQFTTEALAKRAGELYQRAAVVFPHGTNFWSKAKNKK